jgi:uracil-DNA glycosylase
MAISQTKIDAYDALVEKVNNFDKDKLKEMQLVPCMSCREVNFWTYWQGGREHLNADILLVGQDWGAIDYSKEPIADLVVNHPEALKDFCYMRENKNITNQNICDLLAVMYPDVDFRSDRNTQKQLFFTNFVPWYRLPGANISGGYDKRWKEPSTEIFIDLVSIVKPKIIMCLGQKTYNNICDAFNIRNAKKGKNYTEIIEKGCQEAIVDGCKIQVFPLMHPGFWGTKARTIDKQKEDWELVKARLDCTGLEPNM